MRGKDIPKPIRVNVVLHWIGVFVARMTGWRLVGDLPETPKFLVICTPHTSNWDLPALLMLSWVMRIKGWWFAKHTVFWPPLGWMLRAWGGVPVDRSRHHSLVAQATHLFETNDAFVLGIAPEGTRSRIDCWRSGFYHIALSAKVPVVAAFLDFPSKSGGVAGTVHLTGDANADMDAIRALYAPFTGRNPELSGPIRIKEERG
jgi:1-acyl-sn-glycerol-3-phosphate acyltransferase